MELKDLKKLIKGIEKLDIEKINILKETLIIDELNSIKAGENLAECIQYATDRIIENLKKIYQINETDKQENINKIIKEHQGKKIAQLFRVFSEKEIRIIRTTMKETTIKENNENISVLRKLCDIGLCFRTDVKEKIVYNIPQEVKEMWKQSEENIKQEVIIGRLEKIIKMCGAIKEEELYEMYKQNYDENIKIKEFQFYAYAASIIDKYFYEKKGCFIFKNIDESQAEQYIKIQEEKELEEEFVTDLEIIDIYQKDQNIISPIGYDLIKYAKHLKTDIEPTIAFEITEILKEQLKFDAIEILEKVEEFIPALSKTTKTTIMQYIIRMYHDTRLYKYKGFKPFEIGEYLTDEEIKKVENDLKIKFENYEYLRLVDIYPDELSEAYETEVYDEENNVFVNRKVLFLKNDEVRKNKKMVTYLKNKSERELNKIIEIYKMCNNDMSFPREEEALIKMIDICKDEILACNLATLNEKEYEFIQNIAENGGYIEKTDEEIKEKIDMIELKRLIDKGFIFIQEVETNKTEFTRIHMPNDTLIIITEKLDEMKYKKIMELRKLLGGIAKAYGAITKENVRTIVEKVKPDLIELYDNYADIINYEDYDEYSMLYTNIEKSSKKVLAIDYLETDFMKDLLNQTGEYKIFPYDSYIKIDEVSYERTLSSYKKLDKFLKENFNIRAKEIEDIIDSYTVKQQINEVIAQNQLKKSVENRFEVDDKIIKDSILSKIIRMIIDIGNQMPQWKLRGESKKVEKEQTNNEKEIKIGRNDKCPCRFRQKV